MQDLQILNSKEKKAIFKRLEEQFGFKEKLDYAFLRSNKGKIYIVNNEFSKLDLSKLRINTIGLYFARDTGKAIRLTIEGSQLVGPKSKKNIVELNDEEKIYWLKGQDLFIENLFKETDCEGFVLLKCGEDFIGCGKATEGKIYNYVSKGRRLQLSDE